jgi:hypothetical protein
MNVHRSAPPPFNPMNVVLSTPEECDLFEDVVTLVKQYAHPHGPAAKFAENLLKEFQRVRRST